LCFFSHDFVHQVRRYVRRLERRCLISRLIAVLF